MQLPCAGRRSPSPRLSGTQRVMNRSETPRALFGVPRALVGMLHVGPLPGSPGHRAAATSLDGQIDRAVAEALSTADLQAGDGRVEHDEVEGGGMQVCSGRIRG